MHPTVSFNFTVTNTSGLGFLLVFPQGGAQPNASTLNHVANQEDGVWVREEIKS